MDACYMPNFSKCNCAGSCTCPHGYECCQESDNPAGAKATLGICVQPGTCNKKTGHCNSDSIIVPMRHKESFTVNTMEGYYGDKNNCKQWKAAFWMLIMIIFLLLICIVTLATRKQ